ncbi:Oidioi.mRNA.OKI2018_I69.chr1.g52.t1.cds [Oikopleura dioica]|uniref:Oidioi.mRNA.OKI2018_I69.chr1.g52.t1.cds n=1 Tax=Oikopleura dioica TaxID=34765 RepID=A0ABN7SPX2_OIKDI|nr:Oidioi.mRNA.OKI2018_I69.chr1.g52.t1.cds [Oikopleura dioica]
MKDVERFVEEQTSETTCANIAEGAVDAFNRFCAEFDISSKTPEFPECGSNEEIVEWARTAKRIFDENNAKMKGYKESLMTMSRWTLQGTYNYLTHESALKKIAAVANFDHFQGNTLVTVLDNGKLRGFTMNNGTVQKTQRLPGFMRGWKVLTGGRSNVDYRKGGFVSESGNGFKRPNPSEKYDEPRAKRRWGNGYGQRRWNMRSRAQRTKDRVEGSRELALRKGHYLADLRCARATLRRRRGPARFVLVQAYAGAARISSSLSFGEPKNTTAILPCTRKSFDDRLYQFPTTPNQCGVKSGWNAEMRSLSEEDIMLIQCTGWNHNDLYQAMIWVEVQVNRNYSDQKCKSICWYIVLFFLLGGIFGTIMEELSA